MGELPTSNQCAHAQIKRDTHGWRCDDCLRVFFPSGETGAEQETVRLRMALKARVDECDRLEKLCADTARTFMTAGRRLERAVIAEQEGSPVETTASLGPREPDNDMVICPNCTCQFRAIPVNVQKQLRDWEESCTGKHGSQTPCSVVEPSEQRTCLGCGQPYPCPSDCPAGTIVSVTK